MVVEAAESIQDMPTFKMRSQTFNVPAGSLAINWEQWAEEKMIYCT